MPIPTRSELAEKVVQLEKQLDPQLARRVSELEKRIDALEKKLSTLPQTTKRAE